MTRIFASPLAKRLAEKHSLELSEISGTGPRNRIIKLDVTRFLEGKEEQETFSNIIIEPQQREKAISKSWEYIYQNTEYEVLDIDNVRKTIASRLTQSKQETPHFYLHKKAYVNNLIEFRTQINNTLSQYDRKISLNDFIIKSTAMALNDIKEANRIWNGNNILQFNQVDISIAISSEAGLITPVIKNCASLSLSKISEQVKDFSKRASDKKLKPEEYIGGSFSISNLGMFNVDSFDAIINPPQSGILAVGSIQSELKINSDNEIENHQYLNLSLALDHRVIDGVLGAKLLNKVVFYIENPMLSVV